VSLTDFRTQCRTEYAGLSQKKRAKWIRKAVVKEKEYVDEMIVQAALYPNQQFANIIPVVSKIDYKLLNE
jgi:hypothetical protein